MRVLLIFSLLISHGAMAVDDSSHNKIAKKLKKRVERQLSKQDASGYCDLYIEFVHQDKWAKIRRVKGTGDHYVCKVGKKAIKKGERFKYKQPEKYIRIHIAN